MPKNQKNAQRVAKEVIAQIKGNTKINIGEAMRKVGYAPSTSKKPEKVIAQKEFVKTLENELITIDKMIDDAKGIMTTKRNKASYKDGLSAYIELTKLNRLLNNESTENNAMTVKWLDTTE